MLRRCLTKLIENRSFNFTFMVVFRLKTFLELMILQVLASIFIFLAPKCFGRRRCRRPKTMPTFRPKQLFGDELITFSEIKPETDFSDIFGRNSTSVIDVGGVVGVRLRRRRRRRRRRYRRRRRRHFLVRPKIRALLVSASVLILQGHGFTSRQSS